MPPPTPMNNLTYRSENKNGSHAQIVYVNGKPRSESGTVNGKDGHPVIKGDTHNNSQTAKVNGPTGKPLIQGTDKDGSQTAIIKDKDGKPQMEVHSYPNGTQSVTFFDSSGKPMYNMNYLPPPGQQRGSFFTPPAAHDFVPSSNPAITP
ncbi:hypothetical protein K2173_015266 [Erythroxylum novogranatense]|uniref:Uncharacterized protein n=1 Tax=Erythroxylum novogranatense TaxID=1862640 RepID=A0AAV8T2Q4_9ROSI|nr:hypothetical protein K2173_015266 [Erythroxylum novogranatense]